MTINIVNREENRRSFSFSSRLTGQVVFPTHALYVCTYTAIHTMRERNTNALETGFRSSFPTAVSFTTESKFRLSMHHLLETTKSSKLECCYAKNAQMLILKIQNIKFSLKRIFNYLT